MEMHMCSSVICDLKWPIAYLPFTRIDCRVNEITLTKQGFFLLGIAIT